jgi:hypothetical protein
MAAPALKMVADPGDEIDLLEVGHPGFRISASQEEQSLDDATEPLGVGMQAVQDALVLLDCPLPPARDVDRSDQGRQWGSKLM